MKIKNQFLNRLKHQVSYRRKPSRINAYEETNNLQLANRVTLDSTFNLKKRVINIGLVKDKSIYPDYTKFERFIENNKITYDYFDINSSTWIEDVKKYNVIIWRPMSLLWELEEAKEKIYFMEKYLNKLVYPSFNEIVFYENKVLQYYILRNKGFPVIKTFISSNYDEVLDWIKKTEYPIVSKIRTGSGSEGTMLLKNRKHAKKHVKKIFRAGCPTYWPFQKQKNYVFFQKYIKNRGFDLRIIVIDENNIFGYYRTIPKNDFRASGMDLVVKRELPKNAVKIALDVTKKLKYTNLSVDFLQSVVDDKYYIIETAIFIKVMTDEQLKVNEIPGKYQYVYEKDELVFEKGKYWIQELILKRFLEKHFS